VRDWKLLNALILTIDGEITDILPAAEGAFYGSGTVSIGGAGIGARLHRKTHYQFILW